MHSSWRQLKQAEEYKIVLSTCVLWIFFLKSVLMSLSLFQHNSKHYMDSYIARDKIPGSSLTEAFQEVVTQHATIKDHSWSKP